MFLNKNDIETTRLSKNIKSILYEIIDWQLELNDTLEDQIIDATLETVKDIIIQEA